MAYIQEDEMLEGGSKKKKKLINLEEARAYIQEDEMLEGTHFTCVTSTNVQICLTSAKVAGGRDARRYPVYLL
jgi:hypothetical protein